MNNIEIKEITKKRIAHQLNIPLEDVANQGLDFEIAKTYIEVSDKTLDECDVIANRIEEMLECRIEQIELEKKKLIQTNLGLL